MAVRGGACVGVARENPMCARCGGQIRRVPRRPARGAANYHARTRNKNAAGRGKKLGAKTRYLGVRQPTHAPRREAHSRRAIRAAACGTPVPAIRARESRGAGGRHQAREPPARVIPPCQRRAAPGGGARVRGNQQARDEDGEPRPRARPKKGSNADVPAVGATSCRPHAEGPAGVQAVAGTRAQAAPITFPLSSGGPAAREPRAVPQASMQAAKGPRACDAGGREHGPENSQTPDIRRPKEKSGHPRR